MEEIKVEKYILETIANALRLSANILNSRTRETASDREIDYAERLTKWVLGGKVGEKPKIIP